MASVAEKRKAAAAGDGDEVVIGDNKKRGSVSGGETPVNTGGIGVSATDAAAVESSSSIGSGSFANNTRRWVSSSKLFMSVSEMESLLLREASTGGENCRYILLDFQSSSKFLQGHLKSGRCVNVPLSKDFEFREPTTSSGDDGFESKAAAVTFLLDACPEILGYLKTPGFYKAIIIVPTEESVVHLTWYWIRMALFKWNEATTSDVITVLFGLPLFSSRFPELMISEADISAGEVDSDLTSSAKCHLQKLDKLAATYQTMLTLTNKLKSLKEVKSVLLEEGLEKRRMLIPEAYKCPSCRQIFSGSVYMCGNGHNVCLDCLQKSVKCETCKMGYEASVWNNSRNLGLEQRIARCGVFQCVCRERVELRQFQKHADACVRKTLIEVVSGIEYRSARNQRRTLEAKEKLAELKTRLDKLESELYGKLDGSVTTPSTQMESSSAGWDEFVDQVAVKEEIIGNLKKKLLLSMKQ